MKAFALSLLLIAAGCGVQGEEAETTAEIKAGQFCGGIAAFQCPTGLVCVDDPKDSCDPEAGGADCGGICVRDRGCQPERTYVSRDPDQCAAIRFLCVQGREPFFGPHGCGCQCVH